MFFDNDSSSLELLPKKLANLKEFVAISEMTDHITDDFKNSLQQLFLNRFIKTADDLTLSRFEEALGLSRQENETSRYEYIIAKMSSRPPNNINALKKLCFSIIGREVNIFIDYINFLIKVKYSNTLDEKLIKKLANEICKLIPANMILEITRNLGTFKELDGLNTNFNVLNYRRFVWGTFAEMLWDEYERVNNMKISS